MMRRKVVEMMFLSNQRGSRLTIQNHGDFLAVAGGEDVVEKGRFACPQIAYKSFSVSKFIRFLRVWSEPSKCDDLTGTSSDTVNARPPNRQAVVRTA